MVHLSYLIPILLNCHQYSNYGFITLRTDSDYNGFSLISVGKSKEGIMPIIPDLVQEKAVQIAAGAEHSALVTGKKSCIYRYIYYFEIRSTLLNRY